MNRVLNNFKLRGIKIRKLENVTAFCKANSHKIKWKTFFSVDIGFYVKWLHRKKLNF